MSKRHISIAISITKLLMTVFVLVFMYKYILENKDDFVIFTNRPSLTFLLSIFFLYLITVVVQARILLVAQNQQYGFFSKSMINAGFINCCSTMLGYFLPTGAMVSKVYLLNSVFKTPKIESTEIVGRITHIQIIVGLCLGLIVFFAFWLFEGFQQEYVHILLSLLAVCFIFSIVSLVFIRLKSSELSKQRALEFFFSIISSIKPNSKSQLMSIGGLHVFQQLIFSLILMIYCNALGEQVSLFQALFLVSVSSFTLFISLTPGNIGIREGVYFYLASLIGIDPAILIPILLFDRIFQMLVILAFAILFYLWRRIELRRLNV